MSDKDFVNQVVNWQAAMTIAPTHFYLMNAIKSLSRIKYVKSAGFEEGEDMSFSVSDNFCFMITINGGGLQQNSLGNFSLVDAVKIHTSPRITLPRNYGSHVHGLEVPDEKAFKAYSFIHEYGHFMQYVLQPAPMQAIFTILLFEAMKK